MRLTIKFDAVTRGTRQRGKCPVCGKWVERRTTFSQTINPFNVSKKTGLPKTYAEISEELAQAVKTWIPDFTHAKCG